MKTQNVRDKALDKEHGQEPVRRRRRRWPWAVLAVAVALALCVLFLPRILSFGPARTLILARLNRRMNGSVHVASWSLTWRHGFQFNGIRIQDARGHTIAEVQSVNVQATVPMLLGSVPWAITGAFLGYWWSLRMIRRFRERRRGLS